MWIFLSRAMLSIVEDQSDLTTETLLVRARARGDIESVFGKTYEVIEGAGSDYLFRARIPRAVVAKQMRDEINKIYYPNFKNTINVGLPEIDRYTAYLNVWAAMKDFQYVRMVSEAKPIAKRKKKAKAAAAL